MRTISLFITINILLVSSGVSQELVYEAQLDTIKKVGAIYPLLTKDSDHFPLIITNSDSIHSLLIDKSTHKIIALNHEINNPSRLREPVSLSSSNNDFYLLFKNKIKKEYGLVVIANSLKKILESEILFDKHEEFMTSHFYKDTFYILTIRINTSEMYLYRYSSLGEFIDKILIDISQYYNAEDLYSIISSDRPGDYSVNISKIDEDFTQNLITLSVKNKLYARNDSLFILIGNHEKSSQLLRINLNDFTTEFLKFQYPKLMCKDHKFHKFNASLIDNYLFQIYACSKQLALTITDIYNPKNTRNYKCDRKSLNEFQHGITTNSFKEYMLPNERVVTNADINIEFLKKFLKMVMESDLYISINENSDEMYNITIGALNEELDAILPIYIVPSFLVFASYSEYFVTMHYQIGREDLSLHRPGGKTKIFPLEEVNIDFVSKNTIRYGEYYMNYDKKEKRIKIYPISK